MAEERTNALMSEETNKEGGNEKIPNPKTR